MNKFKVGDKVRRINYPYRVMKVGDIGTVTSVSPILLSEFIGYHDGNNLIVITSWKERYSGKK